MSPARALAFDVLLAVEQGAFASDMLAARSPSLSSRDAGLASEIVLGSLRFQAQLDHLIRSHTRREPSRLDPEVRAALRMGIYQLRYLDRIPPHAAVGESVELAKHARKRSAAGLINAVLRRVDQQPVEWPDRATELSHPEWMLARWERFFGTDAMRAIALANLRTPEKYVRVPEADTVQAARNSGLEATDVPGCYRVAGSSTGGFRIQDIGSQAVVPLLDLAPGQRFLDLCAAPGNKTAQALESGVQAVACDVHPRRLAMLRELGIPLLVLNGTEPLPFRGRFERILVDAPCSGTGTLARNPEIKWRLTPEDLTELHHRQVRLLRNALNALERSGRLVYSTCSIEPEENEQVVGVAPGRIVQSMRRMPGRDPGDGFYAAVIESE